MARSINKLSAASVRSLTEPKLHPDGRGLYLCVSKTGAKSWRYIFKHEGKRREFGLGSYPTVSLAEARARAEELAKRRSEGENPDSFRSSAKPEGQPLVSFGQFANDYVDMRQDGWKNAKHRQQWRNSLATYCEPIWDRPIADIGLGDIESILRPIWLAKHETASRLRGRIENVLDAGAIKGLRAGEDPARWKGKLALLMPKAPKGPRRHHASMPYSEVPPFVEELRTKEGLAACALELLIHTATRTSEVLEARWLEFDLENALWTIPAHRMKAGREHRVPLTPRALDVVRSIPEQCELVFPGAKAGRPLSNMSMTQVMRRMNLGHFTVHGFRSSFRDWAADVAHAPREIAEAALAHQVGSEVERAYRRGDALERRRELMWEWTTFVTSA